MTSVIVRAGAALLIGAVTGVACKSNPSPGELDRFIDRRLADRGIAPLPESSASLSAPKPPATQGDPVAQSLAFLEKLDDLMKDFKPELPVIEDKSDLLRCVTSSAMQTNPDVRKVAAAL